MISTTQWKEYRLDEIADIQGGGTPRRSESAYFGGAIPWVTPTDLSAIGKISVLNETKEKITEKGLAKSSAKLVQPGSVLFSSRASVGKIAVTEIACATNQGFANFTPKKEIVDTWFLAYLLCRYTAEITSLAAKTTFLEVPRKKLKSYRVAIPPLSEQRLIVARIKECIERVEEIDELRLQSIEEANAVLPSTLNDIFVDLMSNYKKVEIDEIALETRYGTSKKCETTPTGLPILRIPNVAKGFISYDELKYCDLDDKEIKKLSLSKGDLLFVRTNGSRDLVGRCAIYEGNGNKQRFGFASYLIRVRLDQEQMRPHFLSFFLNSTLGRSELDKRRRTSAGQYNINSENLRNIELPLPPVEVQDHTIEKLQEHQSQIIRLQEELKLNQEHESHLRDSILYKAFSGEL